jgi:hypothetical protein
LGVDSNRLIGSFNSLRRGMPNDRATHPAPCILTPLTGRPQSQAGLAPVSWTGEVLGSGYLV